MRKGFTLIELLVVIVILAIIALIVVPTVLNIIGNTNKSSAEVSMRNLDHAVDLYYQRKEIDGTFRPTTFICQNGECISGNETLKTESKGIERGTIFIDNNGKARFLSMIINGYHCNMINDKVTCILGDESTITSDKEEIFISGGNSNVLNNYKIYGNSGGVGDRVGNNFVIPITLRGTNFADLSKAVIATTTPRTKFKYDNSKGTVELTSTPESYDYIMIYVQRDLNANLKPGKTYYYSADATITDKTTSNKTLILFDITYTGKSGEAYTFTQNKTIHINRTFKYAGSEENLRLIMHPNYGSAEAVNVKYENIYFGELNKFEPYVKPTNFNITISSPLMDGDYIDFQSQSIVRNNGAREYINLPDIRLLDVNTTIFEVNTVNSPKKIEVTYVK